MSAALAIFQENAAHVTSKTTHLSELPMQLTEVSMRHLRALVAVARSGNVHKAANSLFVSQPAVTRAIQELEELLGVALFERTSRNMLPTRAGELMFERAVRALGQMDRAEQELDEARFTDRSGSSLASKITHRHLRTIVAIADQHTEAAAATQLGLSQPSVTRALRELETLIGATLFQRTTRGMVPTPAGEIMIRRAKLLFVELSEAVNDVAALNGEVNARIVIGSLALASALVVRAVTELKRSYPKLSITILEGTIESLQEGLRCGDIDVLVGVLTGPVLLSDMVMEQLFSDRVSVVVRADHPLTSRTNLQLSDLMQWEWVLPYSSAPSRHIFEKAVAEKGLQKPTNIIESTALVTVRGLLLESDRLSILSRHQIHYEVRHGMLAVLPVELDGGGRAIGITTRADAKRSIGVETFICHLREIGALIGPDSQ